MQILLAGPYRPFLKALKYGLEEEGCTVDIASSEEECRLEAAGGGHDVIVLDVLRPDQASLSLVRYCQRVGGKPLVLTPPGAPDPLPPAAPVDCLLKPFSLDSLLSRLRDLVGRR